LNYFKGENMVAWKPMLYGAIAYLVLSVVLPTYVSAVGGFSIVVAALIGGIVAGWGARTGNAAMRGAVAGAIGGVIGGGLLSYFIVIPLGIASTNPILVGLAGNLIGTLAGLSIPVVGGLITAEITVVGLIFGAIGGIVASKIKR